jgi:hypothetical protein
MEVGLTQGIPPLQGWGILVARGPRVALRLPWAITFRAFSPADETGVIPFRTLNLDDETGAIVFRGLNLKGETGAIAFRAFKLGGMTRSILAHDF